jgi:D-sedoheptulose 7-phosphate isomerase
MNNITALVRDARDVREFAAAYFSYVSTLLAQLDTTAIATFIDELETARRHGQTVFIAGNGGSASTASHMAVDFGIGGLAGGGATGLRMLSLTDNTAALTALGNDRSYSDVFAGQLATHYRAGDKLVVISASGNSPNVVVAARWVKDRGGRVIGLLGFDGGELLTLCDVTVHVRTPKGEYGPVEDIHLMVNHLVAAWFLCRERVD